ncbi:IS110 family transposase [Phaeobacter inhibens]|uniref:IS110 family transposase n=1 Tax=Phaeobacter inhibens TaxID=221822 RepID=UPI0021A63F99|nr:IS110 family transposase [Phaeobacter inhibens]UWR57089.1 IS110 family transposase [Phaeobacter inhibens]
MSRWQEKIVKTTDVSYVGIDVSKDKLDVCILPHGCIQQIDNTRKSIRKLVKELKDCNTSIVVMEATGKYHRQAHSILHDAGLAVSIVNPFRSRQFSESLGKMAKSDTIDAEALAQFGMRMEPKVTPPTDDKIRELHDLYVARRQICKEVSDLKRQVQTTDITWIKRQIRARIDMGDRHKKVIENEMEALIASCDELKARFDILTSIPNIGRITAMVLLADLVELGQANAKEIAALAGVAPMNWDSGQKNGNRIIRGGRQPVRNALYMCAVSAITGSDPFGQTYKRLVKRGKNPKIALTAVMRKLVIVANTLITENRHWEPASPLA